MWNACLKIEVAEILAHREKWKTETYCVDPTMWDSIRKMPMISKPRP